MIVICTSWSHRLNFTMWKQKETNNNEFKKKFTFHGDARKQQIYVEIRFNKIIYIIIPINLR